MMKSLQRNAPKDSQQTRRTAHLTRTEDPWGVEELTTRISWPRDAGVLATRLRGCSCVCKRGVSTNAFEQQKVMG